MTVRYMIVDDEAPGRSNLRLALAPYTGWALVAECDGAADARLALAAGDVDVVFLDVQMPGESGLVLARELSMLDEPPLVVFVTAYGEHAVDAFEVHALDYLLKPLNDARLAQAVDRATSMLQQRQRGPFGAALRDYVRAHAAQGAGVIEHVNVRSIGRIEQVRVADIRWIAAAGNYVELHVAGRTILHRIPLNRFEQMLPPADFLRVHRGAIVRRSELARLDSRGDGVWQLALRCGAIVAVSERHLAALKSAL